jgi:SpoIID/LytB domain protein
VYVNERMADASPARHHGWVRVLGRAATLVILGLLAAPATALAGTEVTITGGGFGHGIGMSQYGALGRALNGDGATKILTHYYTGTTVDAQHMPARLRVGLLPNYGGSTASISLSVPADSPGTGRIQFVTDPAGSPIVEGVAGDSFSVQASPTSGMRIYKNGAQVKKGGVSVFGDPNHPLLLEYQKFGSLIHLAAKGRSYAYGHMEFETYPTGSCSGGYCLRLVVVMSMQKYLYGLGEVPASWPPAALQAQAIAGRTYAFKKVLTSGQHDYPCDCAVYDSTIDQAYSGDARRVESGPYWSDWKAAVDVTKSKVILYHGAPIEALYSSSSGGHTENIENVWGGTPVPYLRGVPDAPDGVAANPFHSWTVHMSWDDLQNKLNARYGTGKLRSIKLLKPFGVSGRVTVVTSPTAGGVEIDGSNGRFRESGWSVHSALGLRDTLFRIKISYTVGTRFRDKYSALNGAPGAPTSDVYGVPRGSTRLEGQAQNFRKGRMTWARSTGKVVWQHGVILKKYDAIGRERSPLGMPKSGIWGPGSYVGGSYEHGMILWSDATGAHAVVGAFRAAYRRTGRVKGPLGLPVSERRTAITLPRGGRVQVFLHGRLYLNPDRRAVFALWGPVAGRYVKIGEAASSCGYPIADMSVNDSGATATFRHGTITSTPSGRVRVDCS